MIFRTNPVPKPPRAGEYGILPTSDQELTEYGPASYVPGDRQVAYQLISFLHMFLVDFADNSLKLDSDVAEYHIQYGIADLIAWWS